MYDTDKECKRMVAKLRELCEQKKMKPHTLAKEAGISTSTISYLLNGRTTPRMYTILALCNVLDITINDLFDGDNEEIVEGQMETGEQYIDSEEQKLLRSYRNLGDRKRKILCVFIDMLQQYDENEEKHEI